MIGWVLGVTVGDDANMDPLATPPTASPYYCQSPPRRIRLHGPSLPSEGHHLNKPAHPHRISFSCVSIPIALTLSLSLSSTLSLSLSPYLSPPYLSFLRVVPVFRVKTGSQAGSDRCVSECFFRMDLKAFCLTENFHFISQQNQ